MKTNMYAIPSNEVNMLPAIFTVTLSSTSKSVAIKMRDLYSKSLTNENRHDLLSASVDIVRMMAHRKVKLMAAAAIP